jgi:hypothetical protein
VVLALAPNEGGNPLGTYYKVVLKLDDATTSTEYWVVPKKSPVKLSAVRSSIVPASVAVQMASRQYVDSTLTAKADDTAVIHKIGDETVTGSKQFATSPLVPSPTVGAGAASKSYVDTAVASIGTGDFIRKTGDAMTGALTLSGDPTSTNQAANRHYVDLQVSGLNGAVSQKLARQGDTPIILGGDVADSNNTTFDVIKVEVPKLGTIKRIFVRQNIVAGIVASAEGVTHKVCINSGTNCFGGATFSYNGLSTSGSDITLNQPVAAGDMLAIRVDTPNWATHPTNLRWYATVYIE